MQKFFGRGSAVCSFSDSFYDSSAHTLELSAPKELPAIANVNNFKMHLKISHFRSVYR